MMNKEVATIHIKITQRQREILDKVKYMQLYDKYDNIWGYSYTAALERLIRARDKKKLTSKDLDKLTFGDHKNE